MKMQKNENIDEEDKREKKIKLRSGESGDMLVDEKGKDTKVEKWRKWGYLCREKKRRRQ